MDRPHYDPIAELAVLRDVARELAAHGPFDPRTTPPAAIASLLVPLDMMDVGAAIVIQANMPGVHVADLKVQMMGNVLTLTAQVKPDADYEGAVYLRRERQISTLTRSVPVPVEVQSDRADASFRDGVLTVKLPKIPADVPKTVKVKSS